MRRSLRVSSVFAVVVAAAACGDSTSSGSASTSTIPSSIGTTTSTIALPPPSVPDKPTVAIPSAIPTELQVTVLRDGTGAEAVEGDTVVVHYVGVTSADGIEFDNSYDRGSPFPVENVGFGQVIDGWNQGLIGATSGSQIQLDIPADLAYGENPGEGRPGGALTFVIDVIAVWGKTDAADAPGDSIDPTEPAIEITTTDITPGDGAEVQLGNTVAVQLVAYRSDTGAMLTNATTWTQPIPATLTVGAPDVLPALSKGLVGMQVGGRRQIIVPAAQAYGGEGREEIGLPAGVDVVYVVDLFAAY
jgi:peptidylprolyl isomerase